MAQTLLTPTAVTREALRVLHQKLNFIGTVNRQYDDQYAKEGAKIGSDLKIRLPNEYTVRTGKTIDVQDTAETSVTMTVATQKGVDLSFSSVERTMDIDDFSERYLVPAMSVLAANIESDAMSMYQQVYNEISDVGAAMTLADVLNASKVLTDNLAPYDNRTLNLSTQMNVDLVTATSGLFNDQSKLAKNYREGRVASNSLGFQNIMENTLLPIHTTGSDDGTGDHLASGVVSGGDVTTGSEGAGTLAVGDIVTFDTVNAVHPETKADLGVLKQFVVTAAYSATATTLSVSPAPIATGAYQNISAAIANTDKINKVESDRSTAIGASADYQIGMAYHKDAFAFATADLVKPEGVDFSSRQVLDGISMRIVRAYDINNDQFPCRIDVLYGYKAIRPQLACRIGMN
jgi:hypothetical protein